MSRCILRCLWTLLYASQAADQHLEAVQSLGYGRAVWIVAPVGFDGVSQNQQEVSEPGKGRSRRLVKHISLEQHHPAPPAPVAHQDWAALSLQMQKLQVMPSCKLKSLMAIAAARYMPICTGPYMLTHAP